MAAKENFPDRYFDRFCEAKSVKIAIRKKIFFGGTSRQMTPPGLCTQPH